MSNTPLWKAIEDHDVAGVERSIAQGEDVNSRSSIGLTPLMYAAGCGDAAITRVLLDAGADLFVVGGRGGGSALHKACQAGSLEVVRMLISAGAFVDIPAATTGHTPIIEAIWFKWPEVVEYLLDQNATLDARTRYGFTLDDHIEYGLHANARGRDKLQKCKELVEARRKRDQAQVVQQRLMAAVCAGDLQLVQQLLEAGIDVDERAPVVGGFNDGQTPLSVACRDGHSEIVAELIAAGADVNVIEPIFLAVPLHKAVYNGHADITRMLAEQPGIDLDVQGASNGYTPLHDAVWHGYEDCTQILVDAGARLDLRGHDGLTPLELAVHVFGPDHRIVQHIRDCTEEAAANTCLA